MSIANITDPKASMLEYIEQQAKELELYAKKENAKQLYIEKRNNEISLLCSIYNAIEDLKYYEVWAEIEEEVKRLMNIDKELSGFNIKLRLKSTGNNFGYINNEQ